MSTFLEAVRKASLPGVWSQGVKLARAGAVSIDARDGADTTYRVRVTDAPVAPTVTLYVLEGEWTCDCGGKVDPCQHVAACAIADAQGLTSPADPGASSATAPAPAGPSRLAYQLGRRGGTLLFERLVVAPDGQETELEGSVATRVTRRGDLLPSHDDLALDRVAQGFFRGVVPVVKVPQLLELLESAKDVRLDGHPVRTSRAPVSPVVKLVDGKDGGVDVLVEAARGVSEVVACGLVRLGDTLRPLREMALTGERLELLPQRKHFAAADLATLAGEVLPALEARLDVRVRTTRVPGRTSARVRPRLLFELSQGFHAISVLPLIVYGDPPAARVDGDRLVHLGGPVPARDIPRERTLAVELRERLSLSVGRRVDYEGKEALRFAERLRGFGDEVDDPEALLGHAALVPQVEITGDDLDVRFESEGGGPTVRRASVLAVLRAWEDGFDVVPLEGGGFAPLPATWLSKHGALLAELMEARRDDGTLSKVAIPTLARLCESLDHPAPPGFSALAPLVEGFTGLSAPELPADLTGTLRPYQLEGVAWLAFLQTAELGAILADDMGLGKTLQTLAAVKGRTLVVCPTSVLFNWAAEIARFRPGLRVSTYHGPRRVLDPAADITLTTYGTARTDTGPLSASPWDALVLDEAQAIKNPDSQTARAVYTLPARFRVALSGTPVENRLEELYSLAHFTNPGLLGGLSDFRVRYVQPINEGDESVVAKLRAKIRPFLLRRKKSEVARDLPPRTDHLLYVELDERERTLYDAVRAATKRDLVARLGEGLSVMEALEALLRLRQASCHSGLLPGHSAPTSSKLERLVEELTTLAAEGHRALVFSQWTSLLDRVEPVLARAGLTALRLDGSTRDREGVVRGFQRDDGPNVLLLSLKAGGTGLNLTAADHVFLLDPWWNPAVEDQAADRAHRIGQDKPVFVHRLVAKDTVEERILVLQEKKRALAEAAIGDGGAGMALTRADLLALLE